MGYRLTVHREFFAEVAERLWKGGVDAVRELVENAYDADSSKVLVTFLPHGLVIEDDAGMDRDRLSKFLEVGGKHEETELTRTGRKVVGKYRVGRLSALGAFSKMQVRTRFGSHSASLLIAFDDLTRLSEGNALIPSVDLPPLRRNGTEILLHEPKTQPDYEGVLSMLTHLPILRVPSFSVFVKKSGEFKEWDFEGAERVFPRDIPGVKIPVKLQGIEGVITIADDSALPLAEEDRGIGIGVSAHLVTRSYFGFENSPYRFDRVTGYVECDYIVSTFGSKDRLLDDDAHRQFMNDITHFIQETLIPRLRQAEIQRIDRVDIKVLRKVDRILGASLADASLSFFEQQKLPPRILRMKLGDDAVVKQTDETSVLVLQESLDVPAAELPATADRESIIQALVPSVENNHEEGEDVGRIMQRTPGIEMLQTDEKTQMGIGGGSNSTEGEGTPEPLAAPPAAKKRRVAHYLHDLGVVVLFYEDQNDPRPSYSETNFNLQGTSVKAVFINKKHPSYEKCRKSGLLAHLLRLISNELAALRYLGSQEAIGAANRLYGNAVLKT
jgi:hypothetical protein